jgi:ubiquinone/menaquinone biosynthesis C-methylase UbiE
MNDQHPITDFPDVDKSPSPAHYILMLDFQANMTFVQQLKQRAHTLLDLQPGQQVLDAGSGTGEDVQAMAELVAPTGQVVGLDFSQTMVTVAQGRTQDTNLPMRFIQGDIHALPFAENTFDRCYADKTFQHLPDPQRALAELVRVMKPGGLLLVMDGDHETQVLDTPYPDVTRRFFRFRNDGIRQPDIAHRQYALFKAHGLIDVQVEPMTRITTDYEIMRPLVRFAESMRAAQEYGAVTKEEADLWIAYLEEAVRTERFFHSMTWFITRGRKPLHYVARELTNG